MFCPIVSTPEMTSVVLAAALMDSGDVIF